MGGPACTAMKTETKEFVREREREREREGGGGGGEREV